VTINLNHDYTASCVDGAGNSLVFRDITGSDLEFFDKIVVDSAIKPESIVDILDYLLVSPSIQINSLTPRIIRQVFTLVHTNILKNYMNKEDWLRQCYSIQNGSFQNLTGMEKVPMSKFTAMCLIHKEAMDSIKNDTTPAD
jgi:hypothetical protein